MRIICIGDDGPRRYLAEALVESNHSVMELQAAVDAAYSASAEHVDALIALVAGSAIATARLFAARPAHTALVVIDRQGDEPSRAAALQAGADICLNDPYDYAELHARLLALCGRFAGTPGKPGPQVSSATSVLSLATRSLLAADGTRLLLRKREYLLMDRLLREPGVEVRRDELVDYVFGEADADTTSLHLLVARLRARLVATTVPVTIVTVRGLGYRAVVERD
ncbi:response regulator transcription factor [Paraburkholderia sp. BCC1886]|uniref:response regulator transcription factor n=1 Tax=Paraburkholderia sp. BCC1886 TaxID=2562670 RepID=UPI00118464CD|nr:winged helix-turn-helix domain-containing protein [Paraburkholderia sp. BCC1886]